MEMEKHTLASTTEKRGDLLTLVITDAQNEAHNVPRLMRELKESLSGVDYRVSSLTTPLTRFFVSLGVGWL